jgi:glyoxylase-like metal-dependent hydrolase (beta-lactamase superfamily II)
MSRRRWAMVTATFCILGLAIWLGGFLRGERPGGEWKEIAPGVWRTADMPFGYALVNENHALLIDCPQSARSLKAQAKVETVDFVLLTHHHLDTCASMSDFLSARTPVRAAKASSEFLAPAAVKKFWQESIPLRNSRTAYFMVPVGFDGIDFSLDDGQTIDWRGWSLKVIATPGHSRDHLAFAATREKNQSPLVFCGDALAASGKLWSPYTSDWDHWTDAGLGPTVKSLRALAALKPRVLYPAHGEPISRNPDDALEKTAANAEEMAFMKSFERYSKQRLGHAPAYPYLVPREQIASAGEKPWAKVSEHLYITGNTYVLISKETHAIAVIDPWGARSVKQIAKLKEDLKLGRLELVMFSHAHYDHYDGVYDLPGYAKDSAEPFAVWSLDRVAEPLADPLRIRAPFLDARPVRFDQRYKDGESGQWREYRFRFHHLPGQSEYTMGVETAIDGKRCYFTADNFFHQDQFSGTGGWMGLNRSWPIPYSRSAQKVLDAAPEWILAEHGGPYEFNAEDYRRRVKWGEESARAADALCVSGNHRREWDPYRVQAQPLLQKVKAGSEFQVTIIATATGDKAEPFSILLTGRGLIADQAWTLEAMPGKPKSQQATLRLSEKTPAGRHVFPLRVREKSATDAIDAFFAIDVE